MVQPDRYLDHVHVLVAVVVERSVRVRLLDYQLSYCASTKLQKLQVDHIGFQALAFGLFWAQIIFNCFGSFVNKEGLDEVISTHDSAGKFFSVKKWKIAAANEKQMNEKSMKSDKKSRA